MKNSVLTVTLLGLISFGASAAAAQYNHHDNNVSEASYQVKVNPFAQRDHDEPATKLLTTELRKQALSKSERSVDSVREVYSISQRDHDEPATKLRSTELRKQALGKSDRNIESVREVYSFSQRDHDEPVSKQRT